MGLGQWIELRSGSIFRKPLSSRREKKSSWGRKELKPLERGWERRLKSSKRRSWRHRLICLSRLRRSRRKRIGDRGSWKSGGRGYLRDRESNCQTITRRKQRRRGLKIRRRCNRRFIKLGLRGSSRTTLKRKRSQSRRTRIKASWLKDYSRWTEVWMMESLT